MLIRLSWLVVLLKFTEMGIVICYYNCEFIYIFLQFYQFGYIYFETLLLGAYLFRIVMN